MNLVRAKKVLLNICELNSLPRPIYQLVRKFEKNDDGYVYRQFYEYCVVVGEQAFSGKALSKRKAQRVAAYEAIKHLRFTKCRRNAVTELVELCTDLGFMAQILADKKTQSSYVEVRFQFEDKEICLHANGFIDSFTLANEAAAKIVLDQLIVLLQYKKK